MIYIRSMESAAMAAVLGDARAAADPGDETVVVAVVVAAEAAEFAAMAADPGDETAAVAAEVAAEAADPGCTAAGVGGVGAAGGRGGDPARSSGGEVVLVRT